jgi:CheY-like chemotaxis protein
MIKIEAGSVIQVLLIKHPDAEFFPVKEDSAFHFDHINIVNESLDIVSIDKEKHYDTVWYLQAANINLSQDTLWEDVSCRFLRSPKIVWSYTKQNLKPSLETNSPFLIIRRDQFYERRIQGLLISAQQFYSIKHQSLGLVADVEVTQQTADLNIDRLHKTIKELEKERDKSLVTNKAKQSFIAIVTHELITPLNAIVGFLEILQETELDEDQLSYTNLIKSASRNLLSLVNDILNFSKIEEGKLTIFKQSFDLKDLNVLVVEDNKLNQMLIQKILTPAVKMLRICGDGESAVQVAGEMLFDVILTDLNLPRMNGFEMLQSIRKQGLNKETPVAVVSANIWEEELSKVRNAGVEIIIHKPFTKEDLLLKVVELSKQKEKYKLDLTYLNEISDFDQVFIEKILKTFIINSEVDFNTLNKAFESSNFKILREVAHKMRSTFSMLKQEGLVNLCISIEDESTTTHKDIIVKFRNKLDLLQGLVRNYLEN